VTLLVFSPWRGHISLEREENAWDAFHAERLEDILRGLMSFAEDNAARSFEFQSPEEAGYSVKGVLDYCFVTVPNGAQVNLEKTWDVREYWKGKPLNERFFYRIEDQSGRPSFDMNGYWHSGYFTFGPDIGGAIGLANMRFVWREMARLRIGLAQKTLKQVMELKPGEERPVIVLACDMFGTHGMSFNEEKMKASYPSLWERVTSVEEQKILDCQLLLETETELAELTLTLSVKLVTEDAILRKLMNMAKTGKCRDV
jgi:hypothetical protein